MASPVSDKTKGISSPSIPSKSDAGNSKILDTVKDFATKYFNEIVFVAMSAVAAVMTPGPFLVGATLGIVAGTLVDDRKISSCFRFIADKIHAQMPKSLIETAQRMNNAVKDFVQQALEKSYYVSGNETLAQGLNAMGALYGVGPFGFLAGFQAGLTVGREFLADLIQSQTRPVSSYPTVELNQQ